MADYRRSSRNTSSVWQICICPTTANACAHTIVGWLTAEVYGAHPPGYRPHDWQTLAGLVGVSQMHT